MGIRNYLIDGMSGTGKTSVCHELRRRGYHAINGDRELAYHGDPETGEPLDRSEHEHDLQFGYDHHIWDVGKVKALVSDKRNPVTFFCGGSRNSVRFIDLFDGVFVLQADLDTVIMRLATRPEDEWGGKPVEREMAVRLHKTKEGLAQNGIVIDATVPLERVVNEILRRCNEKEQT